MNRRVVSLLGIPLTLGVLASHARAAELVAIVVGRAITVTGDEVEDAVILIEGGRIRELGSGLDIPTGAEVHRFPDGVAMPGMILCDSVTGLRVPNERLADVPFATVLDGIDPSSAGLENSLRDGITTVHVAPSNVSRVGAQTAVIRTAGRFVDDMIVKAPLGLKISLSPNTGETRMGNMTALRTLFFELWKRLEVIQERKAKDAKKAAAQEAGAQTTGVEESGAQKGGAEVMPEPIPATKSASERLDALLRMRPDWSSIRWDELEEADIPERDRELVDLVRGKLRAYIYCGSAADVFKAFELIDTNGLDATLVLGSDAWKIADVLAAREGLGPVIIDPTLEVWDADTRTGAEVRRVIPRILHEKGIRFALQPAEDSRFNRGPYLSRDGAYHMWYQAARLVRNGLSRAEAFRAVTLTPAEIIGLEHRLGSLEPGKDANVAIYSGDPLDVRSWVELVLLEGSVVYRRAEDTELELLLEKPKRPF